MPEVQTSSESPVDDSLQNINTVDVNNVGQCDIALSEGGFSLFSRIVSSPRSRKEARGSTKLFHQLSLASLSPLTLSLHEQTAPASFPVHLYHRLLHFLHQPSPLTLPVGWWEAPFMC